QFEEDTNLRATLLVDVSGSMQYGSGAMNKYEYAATIAVSLAYLLLRQQDAVGSITFDESIRVKVPQRTRRSHLNSIVQALSASEPQEKSDVLPILRGAAETYPRRGLMILVSDLLVDRAGLFKGLKLLRQHGHDVIVFHVMDDEELDFPFTGPTRFEGLELPQHLSCNPRALRQGYLDALGVYLDEVRRGCAQGEVDYVLLRTSQPLDAALAAFLSNRQGTQRK
ncbi:MAG: VWA domain-containing protein, partial [Planctomycetia bacterium]|nr:VWA domain-containing protein [Planctomycetia bacterium]